MFVKIKVEFGNKTDFQLIGIYEDSYNLGMYDKYFSKVRKEWKKLCENAKSIGECFAIFYDLMSKYDIAYYDMTIEQEVKVKIGEMK